MVDWDLNESLDNYLEGRRKGDNPKSKFKVKIFKKDKPTTVKEEFPDLVDGQVHVIHSDEPFYKRMFRKKSAKDDDEVEVTDDVLSDNVSDDEFQREDQEMKEEVRESHAFTERVKAAYAIITGKKPPVVEEEYTTHYEEVDRDLKTERMVDELVEIERKEEELLQEEKELQREKRGVLGSFLSLFRSEKIEEPQEEPEEVHTKEELQELSDDLKEVSRFTIAVIQQLPKRKRDDLKESDAMKEFKGILLKHNLIKEK